MGTARRLLIALIVSLAAAGCAPIGSIGATSSIDDFWVVSQRYEYELGDSFNRDKDLRVFISYQGIVEPIPVKDVDISIVTTGNTPQTFVVENTTYRISPSVGKGRKLIVVTYNNSSAEYSIQVEDPSGLTDGEEDEGGSGIGVIWPE
ncbi:MAG TPA: hypothetical protein DEQ14_11910 [Treponema sp.]|nr:hypothetical protein [Treponema sp.]